MKFNIVGPIQPTGRCDKIDDGELCMKFHHHSYIHVHIHIHTRHGKEWGKRW